LLAGGWLDHEIALDMAGRLARERSILNRSRSEAARNDAEARWLPREIVEEELLMSLADLTAMLEQVPAGEDLWIVKD